jgi:Putative DNA-binding domain
MPIPPSRELLDDLLSGKHLAPGDLDQLIQRQPREDLYLDYKDGIVTRNNPAQARQIIREYLSGFANSDGGTLVMGVAENPRAVSACVRQGGMPLDDWAQRVIADMAPFFSPQPRFHVVAHAQGEVFVAAVSRAPQLVPCVTSRELKYFFRMHDSTVEAPPFLISDLVLGRRQHPVVDLRVRDVTVEVGRCPSEDGDRVYTALGLGFYLVVESLSMARAEEVEVGIISWAVMDNPTRLNRQLESYVDAGDTPDSSGFDRPLRWRLHHMRSDLGRQRPGVLRPFGEVSTPEIVRVWVPVHDGRAAILQCGVYVMPQGSPPTWFELLFRYDARGAGQPAERVARTTITPAGLDRPRLRWMLDPPLRP